MKKISFTALACSVGLMALAQVSLAQTQQNYCGTDKIADKSGRAIESCKNIPGNRRAELGKLVKGGNPVAVTNQNGDLFVYYTVGGAKLAKCQVTNNVRSFKMSQNPGDVATAYYERDGKLMDLRMEGEVSASKCPKKEVKDMQQQAGIGGVLQDYTIISNSNSSIVGIAKTTNGVLIWSDRSIEATATGFFSDIDGEYNRLKSQLQ